jgi:hypothetical protein
VEVDTRAGGSGRYVFQDVGSAAACFRWSFSVLREEGTNIAELVANWDRSAGNVDWASAVTFGDTGTTFRAWNAAQELPFVLTPGARHSILVEADARTPSQRLSVDGTTVSTVRQRHRPSTSTRSSTTFTAEATSISRSTTPPRRPIAGIPSCTRSA